MTEVPDQVKTSISSPEAQHALCLLRYYGFELTTYTVEEQIAEWLEHYPARMIVQAIIEALYQGRYKTVSVNQILALWHRRGQTICHFNGEFERLVGGNLPVAVQSPPAVKEPPVPASSPKPIQSYREMLLELPSVRAASKLKHLTEIPSLKLSQMRISEEPGNGISSDSPPPISTIAEVRNSPTAGLKSPEFKLQPPASDQLDKPEPDPEREFKEFKEGVVFALSSGLAAHTLKPRMRLLLSRLYQIDWLQFCTSSKAIEQFVPALKPSEFHNKLKTVAEPGESEQK
ncbi:MAG: hypothetical protein OHK0047_34120 [Leptolyngbyaceae cyanobacterium]